MEKNKGSKSKTIRSKKKKLIEKSIKMSTMIKIVESATEKFQKALQELLISYQALPDNVVTKTKIRTDMLLLLDECISTTHRVTRSTPIWLGVFIFDELTKIWNTIKLIRVDDNNGTNPLIDNDRFLSMLIDIECIDDQLHFTYYQAIKSILSSFNKNSFYNITAPKEILVPKYKPEMNFMNMGLPPMVNAMGENITPPFINPMSNMTTAFANEDEFISYIDAKKLLHKGVSNGLPDMPLTDESTSIDVVKMWKGFANGNSNTLHTIEKTIQSILYI